MSLTVVPAYGRDYTSKKLVLEDWEANKDFRIIEGSANGSYLNKSDAEQNGLEVWVRYGNMRQIMKVTQ